MESELSVRDVLTTDYVGVSESDTVRGAVELLREERASCALVVRGADAVGIVTEWDVLGVVADDRDPAATTVGDVMSTPVITFGPDRSLADAAATMARENVRNVVIESEDGVVGVVTERDVVAAVGSHQTGVASPTADEGVLEANQPSDDRAQPTATGEPDARAVTNGGDEYSTQGVCETCGSLADALWESNGQLVCTDCRSV